MSDPPDPLDSLYSQALSHHQSGDLQQADALYRHILSLNPDHVLTLLMLGVLAHQISRNEAAIQLLTRAIQLAPTNPDTHNNLAVALAATGEFDKAIASYYASLSLRPDDPRTLNNLATALRDAGRLPESIAFYSRAISFNPDFAEAHDNLALAYQQLGDLPKALAHFRRATELSPQSPDFHAHLAFALRESGNLDDSIASANHALSLDPNNTAALTTLGSSLKDVGRLDESLAAYRRAADLPNGAEAYDSYLFALHLHPDYTPKRILDEHKKWATRFSPPLAASHSSLPKDSPRSKDPTRPLRIGYVSPDFRHHVVAHNILPLFQIHDRSQFQIYCYSNTPRHDDLTATFRSLSTWRDINHLPDDAVARLIASDDIDILVDLALHTTGNRLGVFALKPAPLQATFAGYPSTTGLQSIDYRLTDPHLDPPDPPDKHDYFYTEQSLRLPHTFWCYTPNPQDPPVNPLPSLTNNHITFGYLGAFSKINAPILKLWTQVMNSLPNSRLILMSRPGSPRTRTLSHFATHNISPSRIQFVDYQPRSQYLSTYHRIDIVLDTHPYNGHTTNLDALYMGVPVVSLHSPSAVSRAALSQLTNFNLQALSTDNPTQFLHIANSLASDLPSLSTLRSTLRQRMLNSPLTDAHSFTRDIESAYRQMWRCYCNST